MSKSINQVILMGNLTRDPEVRMTKNDKKIVKFGLAVQSQSQDDQAYFFDVKCFGKLGELVEQYLSKGSKCIVMGKLYQYSYETEAGEKRNKIDVIANDVTFVGSKKDKEESEEIDLTGIDF